MVKKLLVNYWNDRFWRNNAIFLVGSLFVSFLNYLYYPILSRTIDISSFGEVLTLLSIFNLIGMLLVAFQIVIVNISANNIKTGTQIAQQFEYLALIFMIAVFILMTAASTQLQQFFSLDSSIPFVILGLIMVLTVPIAFRSSFIEGKQNFVAVSISNIIAALGKIFFSILLIVVGFQTLGAIAGILIAQFLAFLYITFIAKRMGFTSTRHKKLSMPDFTLIKPELRYLFSVMIVFFIVTFFYTADVLIVKRYFDSEVAGQYAGISAIAKILFFATASFSAVLLASIGQYYTLDHNRRTTLRSFLLVIFVGGPTLLLFTLFPEAIINLMLGGRYVELAYLLPPLSFVIFLVSIINLCFYYFLAMREYIIVPTAVIGGVITFFLTAARHSNLEAIIQNFMVGSIIILLLMTGLGAFSYLKPHKETT